MRKKFYRQKKFWTLFRQKKKNFRQKKNFLPVIKTCNPFNSNCGGFLTSNRIIPITRPMIPSGIAARQIESIIQHQDIFSRFFLQISFQKSQRTTNRSQTTNFTENTRVFEWGKLSEWPIEVKWQIFPKTPEFLNEEKLLSDQFRSNGKFFRGRDGVNFQQSNSDTMSKIFTANW